MKTKNISRPHDSREEIIRHMNTIHSELFRAIHEGKWLAISYRNRENRLTNYWIAIRELDIQHMTLRVDALHIGKYSTLRIEKIFIDAIESAEIVEGTYCPVNEALVRRIAEYPDSYRRLFDSPLNLQILSYLEACYRMDTTPYKANYSLVDAIDTDVLGQGAYPLNDRQFREIVQSFQKKTESESLKDRLITETLAVNVLSIHTEKGLYVLAYRNVFLDVMRKTLVQDPEITVCMEFQLQGQKEMVRNFLDAEDYGLLRDFRGNAEKIKDAVTKSRGKRIRVDDRPYLIAIGTNIPVDLHKEYRAITEMMEGENAPVPLQVFFGKYLARAKGRRKRPLALVEGGINTDQMLAVHNAITEPVSYVQGPPGTGKTTTIVNTITTAYFNQQTVLFSSGNNTPLDGVFAKLSGLDYEGEHIPFPVLRLGNADVLGEVAPYVRRLLAEAEAIPAAEETLRKEARERTERVAELSRRLKDHARRVDMKERLAALETLIEHSRDVGWRPELLPFHADLAGRQVDEIRKKLDEMKDITGAEARALLEMDEDSFRAWLYRDSARRIRMLREAQYSGFMEILETEDKEKQARQINRYIANPENLTLLLKVFPVIITTSISAARLGKPGQYFDMVILDEASQCNLALSLIPILRGKNLMLVGDPQQLDPVILLGEETEQRLKEKYRIDDAYDYRTQSIYKTYLACDQINDEILLHSHYRCHEKIIAFNNRKYYRSRLEVLSQIDEEEPLVYIDVNGHSDGSKNTSVEEAEYIAAYIGAVPDASVGIITPFVNQRLLIEATLKRQGITDVTCGTVHAFQGEERDIILFSTAITEDTFQGSYEWLKNNRELINVATSRARRRLVLLSDLKNLRRLHTEGRDDLYELVEYVRSNGKVEITPNEAATRALGLRPFSTETEQAFFDTLLHALTVVGTNQYRYNVKKEVPVSQVFFNNPAGSALFYTGRFDFVVYEYLGREELPVLAIELDGPEHKHNPARARSDREKDAICERAGLQLIHVENTYARRYHYIKDILTNFFKSRR